MPKAVHGSMTQVPRWDITIGEHVFRNLEVADQWEGMVKLQGAHGVIVIQPDKESLGSEFSAIFADIFGRQALESPEPIEFSIVKASPPYLDALASVAGKEKSSD